jgi:hypothetical protein
MAINSLEIETSFRNMMLFYLKKENSAGASENSI